MNKRAKSMKHKTSISPMPRFIWSLYGFVDYDNI